MIRSFVKYHYPKCKRIHLNGCESLMVHLVMIANCVYILVLYRYHITAPRGELFTHQQSQKYRDINKYNIQMMSQSST